MMGCQCSKRLYLYKKHPELREEISAAQQQVFQRGTNIGLLAQQLFPGGKDATPVDHYHYQDSVKQTGDWITQGEKIIYEATFQYDKVLAALDILVCKNGKWKAYEVKSSTEVKEQFITDAALQYYVITRSGLPLADISIIHINNEYVRGGEINIKELFTIQSVKKEVLQLQDYIEERIIENKKVLGLKAMPKVDIGPHCSSPYECEFMGYCWSHIPEISVFSLTRMKGEKKFQLYNEGIIELHQLHKGIELTESQTLQVRGHLENHTHINREQIKGWLKKLKYPLVYMDFETFQPGVPLYDGCRPYQFVPFQFSVHRQEKPGGTFQHFEYLGEPQSDPRPEFIRQLIAATKGKGTVLVYNRSFEPARLRELQNAFPEYRDQIENILVRIEDLMEPFQKKWYYLPGMNGSYSIKVVLPALIPELSYNDLEIGEGGAAMAAFEGLLNITDENEKQKIRTALLEYCKLDTWAMVKILEKLQ